MPASSTDRSQASGPDQPAYSVFQPWGTNTPTPSPPRPSGAPGAWLM